MNIGILLADPDTKGDEFQDKKAKKKAAKTAQLAAEKESSRIQQNIIISPRKMDGLSLYKALLLALASEN